MSKDSDKKFLVPKERTDIFNTFFSHFDFIGPSIINFNWVDAIKNNPSLKQYYHFISLKVFESWFIKIFIVYYSLILIFKL